MLQVALTIVFYIWLFLVLLLLWLMWISSVRISRQLQETLVTASLTSAEAAQKSAEAAQRVATHLERKNHAD